MRRMFLLVSMVFVVSFSFADDGLIRVKSANSVDETIEKFQQAILAKGMTVFTRIDHAKGAEKVGIELRPTEVLIFGNPKIGTKLMLCSQSIGIDLPLKVLASQDEAGQVWLSYNTPQYLANRHGIEECKGVLAKMTKALAKFSTVATASSP